MLSISGLSKRYGDVQAIDDVGFDVRPGRLVGFVGPNGAGKSTTMRSIFGLVEPDAGTITWNGDPISGDHLRQFGYMPEQRGLYPKMKIAEQVAFFAELKQVERKAARQRAEEILTTLGLGDRLDDPLEKLSHGNQQRVQLAVSIANDPVLMVLDEPFNGLDPIAVNTLRTSLDERVAEGSGVLFSSHQLDLVERLCDEIVIIVGGRVRASGTPRSIRAATGRRTVEIEVEHPQMPLSQALDRFDFVEGSTASATVAVDDTSALSALMEAAGRAGEVTRFDFDLPSLESCFADIVEAHAAEQPEIDTEVMV